MKRKIILFGTFVFICTLMTSLLIFKNNKNIFNHDGMLLAVTLNGDPINKFPERGNYDVKVECKNGVGKWLSEEWNLVIEDIKGKVSCNLNFTDSPQTLLSTVENNSEIIKEEFKFADYSAASKLTSDEYKNSSVFYSSYTTSTTGTSSTAFTFNETDVTWNAATSGMSTSRYYHLKFDVPEAGFYRVCYSISAGDIDNVLYFYKNSERYGNFFSADANKAQNDCVDLGEFSDTDYIKITRSASYSSIPTIKIYVEKANDVNTYDAGYRYVGNNPNNYIWFNNEIWRIIGSIPTKIDDNTTSNLIKIVKNEPINSLVYDAKSEGYTGIWGNNTLYTLLNNYYYDGNNDDNKNGTDTVYCYILKDTTKTVCDYTVTGLSKNKFYSQMLKTVYWKTGSVSGNPTARGAFVSETLNQSVQGYVGLINPSDYGFAVPISISNRDTLLEKYNTSSITYNNWLYDYGGTYTMNEAAESYVNVIRYSGDIGQNYSYYSSIIKPVIYLNENVYVVSGDGTEANPYQIAM